MAKIMDPILPILSILRYWTIILGFFGGPGRWRMQEADSEISGFIRALNKDSVFGFRTAGILKQGPKLLAALFQHTTVIFATSESFFWVAGKELKNYVSITQKPQYLSYIHIMPT